MGLFKWLNKSSDQGGTAPAGWYPVEQPAGHERWWDGRQWTEQVRAVEPEESLDDVLAGTVEMMLIGKKPVRPWANATIWQRVVGESSYMDALHEIVSVHRRERGEHSAEINDLHATLYADTTNAYDDNAVAVLIQDRLVGYLPRDVAALYSPPLQDLDERRECLTVQSRIWVGDTMASVTVRLPPAHGVQSFNELPEEPHQVLPHGGTLQVTGEENHMDVLGRYISEGERYLAVTLHLIEERKTERSQPFQCIEVRLDGQRVGALSKASSEKLADVVLFVSDQGKVPVCRAVLKGSPLRAELALYVAKSHEVTQRWLDRVATGKAYG